MCYSPYTHGKCCKHGGLQVGGCGWHEASCDIVMSGLGWFSVTGAGSCVVRVLAPKGVMVVQRDPLMPFEARNSMGKSTGGRIVKKTFKGKIARSDSPRW